MDTSLASTGFADDPIAPPSAQFPLGRVGGIPDHGVASSPQVRPWGLGGMRPALHQGDSALAAFRYDHSTQTATDNIGRTLVSADPTANKVTSSDGDEGPSEDFTYDFCPDYSIQA